MKEKSIPTEKKHTSRIFLLKPVLLSAFFVLMFGYSKAQKIDKSKEKANIKGTVIDSWENKKLQNCIALIIRNTDSVMIKSVRTDANGGFLLDGILPGNYSLLVSYPKMADYVQDIKLSGESSIDLGFIYMESEAMLLKEVVIKARKEAVRKKGDTVVYMADSFAVRPNASVQDLLRRLPGVEVDKDGAIKASGKDVNTVLIDGEEFFGDDPLLATKYLKANAISEVQVYDKKGHEAELTGIKDGKREKVINIKLKDDSKNGYLSTLDANSNLAHYKNLGGMAGIYKGKLKAALFGNSNNLNQESKAMSKLRSKSYDVILMDDDEKEIISSNGKDGYLSAANGLPSFTNYGAYLSNKWAEDKLSLKLNYKNTYKDISGTNNSDSQKLLPDGTGFFNSEKRNANSHQHMQDLSGDIEIELDSLSKMNISFEGRKNLGNNYLIESDLSKNEKDQVVSQNNQQNSSDGNGLAINGNVGYSRKSKKIGRTFSINLQPRIASSSSNETTLSNTIYGPQNLNEKLDLLKDNSSKENSLGGRISYTEPIDRNWRIQAAYSFKLSSSNSNSTVYDNRQSRSPVDSLANNFDFKSFSNGGKMVIQYQNAKISVGAGIEAIKTDFGLEDIGNNDKFNRSYLNWAPRGNIE